MWRKIGRMKSLLLTILIVLIGSSILSAQEISIIASVDKNPVGLNDQFTYQVEVSSSSQNLPDPRLPNLADFSVLAGPNTSSSFQIVNFDMKASKTITLILMPLKEGNLEIPPAVVEFKGKTYLSNSISITVTKGTQSQSQKKPNPRQGTSGDADISESIFFKAEPSKKSVYVHEQINLSYKIYFRANIRNPEFLKLPETVGFWVEEFPIKGDIPIRQEVINGLQYNVAEIKKMALFPSKTGKLSISPLVLRLDVVMQRQKRRSSSFFDDFFDNPFGRVVSKEFSSNEVTINVKPLPGENKPADFSGLVGTFRISSEFDKTTVPANEALSLKVRLSGTGNLKVVNEIPIEIPSSFEMFQPKMKDKINHHESYISENKEFEYVMIPRMPGNFNIPPISVSYFDPLKKEYNTLDTEEYNISVSKGVEIPGSLSSGYLAKEDVKLLGRDINFIKESIEELTPINYAAHKTIWFWLLLILPGIAVISAYGYRNHLEKISTNVEYARKRKAHKAAKQQLKNASHLLKVGKIADFYGEVSNALLGYVANKTNQSAAGFVREDVQKILDQKKVDDELSNNYINCLDEADYRRFAPGRNSEADAGSFYNKAEDILVRMEKYF
jgi:hypothetical protein